MKGPGSVDYAVDVVGSGLGGVAAEGAPSCCSASRESQARRGAASDHQSGVSVLGTWLANDSFPRAVKARERANLRSLITHTLPLDKTRDAIEILRRGEGVKIMVDLRL
jgi:threonine dehydrogenase-like Zn-dependent dehydrogenase